MQTIINHFALLLMGLVLQPQNTAEVSMTNINNNATVKVDVCNSQGDWLEREFKVVNSKTTNKAAKATFIPIADGVYALSCFHDETNDGKFKIFIGIFAAEDYVCSTSAIGMFGPPEWKDASFELKNYETKHVPIKL